MNKTLGWLIALGGGYFVLKHFGIDPLTLIEGQGSSTPTTSTSPQGGSNPSAVSQSHTLSQMLDALHKDNVDPNSNQVVDVWNYYYNLVRGIAGPAPEVLFVGADRNKKYSLQEYWAAMTSAGFSGLGSIAHYVNPYQNPVGNRPYQANAHLNLFERYNVKFGG